MKSLFKITLLLTTLAIISSCQQEPVFINEPEAYIFPEPSVRYPKLVIPEDNPTTVQGVELGRHLFYDTKLSDNQSISCATCHLQGISFTDGTKTSVGVGGRKGTRNAPSLVNVAYMETGLFWDGRAVTLEEQALHPVENSDEMGTNWEAVVKRLKEDHYYPKAFKSAFPQEKEITKELAAKALAQFQRTILSYNSKYDRVQRGETYFTAAELRGMYIFFDSSMKYPHAECNHCHVEPLFTNLSYKNNGLDKAMELDDFPDKGRGEVSGKIFDNGKFKVPALLNVEYTAPYMHDGRFKTLEEVIDHYNSGGHYADNRDANIRKLNLSDRDKADLVAFLKTLTDTTLLNNKDFESPF